MMNRDIAVKHFYRHIKALKEFYATKTATVRIHYGNTLFCREEYRGI